jgi:rhomboid protease GluP
MHANLVHLIVNMFGLWSVGRIFEYIAGSKNFFLLYIIAGISGNICSFALIPYLSVGASGSLFGILLCLYVIQKYEERIANQLKCSSSNMQLGKIILINIIINIAFGLFSSIFDWAAHLGGSVAGVLFGFALTTRHKWNLKVILSANAQLKMKKRFFEHYQIYYFGILLINILFLMSYFKIKKYQQIFGIAIERAANNDTMFLPYSDLSQFKDILVEQNKETKPENMLNGALTLHSKGYYFPSSKIYEVLLSMSERDYGSKSFSSAYTKDLILKSLDLAKQEKELPKSSLEKIKPVEDISSSDEICSKPAKLFMTLGYYQVSGKLFECAYALNVKNEEYAINSIESFHLADDNNSINQVLSIINFIEKK